MPNAVALISEFAPKKLRSTLVAIMFSGYSVGGMLSAGLGFYLLPTHGWQSVFYFAAVPLIVLPLILRAVPESVLFTVRNGQIEKAQDLLRRIEPSYIPRGDDNLSVSKVEASKGGAMQLFSEGRMASTLLLWASCFCCLLMIYALSS